MATITAYEKLFEGKQLNKSKQVTKRSFMMKRNGDTFTEFEFEDYLDQNFYTYFYI